jgi:hypothetical protein
MGLGSTAPTASAGVSFRSAFSTRFAIPGIHGMEELIQGQILPFCDLGTTARGGPEFALCRSNNGEAIMEVTVQRFTHESGVGAALLSADAMHFREHLFRERNGYRLPCSRHSRCQESGPLFQAYYSAAALGVGAKQPCVLPGCGSQIIVRPMLDAAASAVTWA